MDFFDDTGSVCCETIMQNLSIIETIVWKVKPPWCVHHHYPVKQLHPRPC